MSNQDFEPFSDGDWEDRGEIAWNEQDWRQFLGRHHLELQKYLETYESLRYEDDRLDEAARIMGWDTSDWLTLSDEDEDDSEESGESWQMSDESEEDFTNDPYTLHKHPVYIVTKALYSFLYSSWEAYTAQAPFPPGSSLNWNFGRSLHEGEMQAIMGLNALDMGDVALTICHLKLALSSVNRSLALLQSLPASQSQMTKIYAEEARVRLFDLREVWLRVIRDCREETQRRFREGF